jgi:hypothetical protein
LFQGGDQGQDGGLGLGRNGVPERCGTEGGGTIPSTSKLLYRKFDLGMARAAPKSRVARGERLNSYTKRMTTAGNIAEAQQRTTDKGQRTKDRLREIPAEDLFAKGDVGLLPWVPLAKFPRPPKPIVSRCRTRIDQETSPPDRDDFLAASQFLLPLR